MRRYNLNYDYLINLKPKNYLIYIIIILISINIIISLFY